MTSKRALERRLADLDGFDAPRLDLEQYRTPAELAASVVHRADLHGDVSGRTVVDLGSGTGVFALGAALRGASRVVGVERDAAAIDIARRNERRLDPSASIGWLRGDATRIPLCPEGPVTVLMNPPFGAQRGNVHADRAFLATGAELAAVSYSVHNENSRDFVAAFTEDWGGTPTHAFAARMSLPRQYDHHAADASEIGVEVFRIEWNSDA